MNNNLNPITRQEMFLAKAAGQEVPTPTPITRIEKFLQNLIDHISAIGGGSSGTGGGITKYYVQSARKDYGDSYLYHTADGAKNGDESLRVTKEQLQNVIDSSALVIKDTDTEFYWTPSCTYIGDTYGQALINVNTVVYTSEYGSGPM